MFRLALLLCLPAAAAQATVQAELAALRQTLDEQNATISESARSGPNRRAAPPPFFDPTLQETAFGSYLSGVRAPFTTGIQDPGPTCAQQNR